jgi:hypothetical protein
LATTPNDPERRLYAEAREWAYQRLAFASAAIWAGGTAFLYWTYVPFIEHPQLYIAIASVAPLAPAALPWLGFRWLTAARARRLRTRPRSNGAV